MAQQQTFAQRIGWLAPCVGLATILDDSEMRLEEESEGKPLSLRQEASHDGLCYLRVLHQVNRSDLYCAEVAATPKLLEEQPLPAFFTEEQLRCTLAYDCRTSTMCQNHPDRLVALLRSCAAELQPLTRKSVQETQVQQPEPAVALMPLNGEVIEVTTEAIQDVLVPTSSRSHRVALSPFFAKLVGTESQAATKAQDKVPDGEIVPRSVNVSRLQQTLLNAAIDHLMNKLYQTKDRAQALALQSRCALLARLQRWQRQHRDQRVVEAVQIINKQQCQVMWQLFIDVPVGFSALI